MQSCTIKRFRNIQLRFMAVTAGALAPLTALVAMQLHGRPMPMSISEGGTIPNAVSPLLPFALGALAIFALSYALALAHDRLDCACTLCMAAGFTVVAFQMVDSPYVQSMERVGVFALSPAASDVVHVAGALVGFGAMIVWIGICFRKSDKPPKYRTLEKHKRNLVYAIMGLLMLGAVGLFVPYRLGWLGAGFAIVFWVEAAILLFAFVSLLVKSGAVFADKGVTK